MINIKQLKREDSEFPVLLAECHNIRRIVFVVEQEVPQEIEYEYEDQATHFIAYYNGVVAATARYRETEKGYKIERCAVLKEYRGLNIGYVLCKHLIETLNKEKTIYLHAQKQAIPFYMKIGFEETGKKFFEADIEHIKMTFKC